MDSRVSNRMSHGHHWFGFEVVNNLFPFFFLFDASLCVLKTGDSLKKLEPGLVSGACLGDFFSIRNPRISLNFGQINARVNSQHTWILNKKIIFRGQLVSVQERQSLLFIGSPWIATVEQLGELGLSASDFARHDATLEHLFLQQAQVTQAADRERMVESLQRSAEAYKKLEKLQSKLAFELNIAYDLKVRFNGSGVLIDIQATSILPYQFNVSECIGKNIYSVLPFLAEPLSQSIDDAKVGEKPVAISFRISNKGNIHYFDARLALDPDGLYLLLASDVTQDHLLKLQLEKRANFDSLTGLPNRAYFFEQITGKSNVKNDGAAISALMLVDLDNFKTINDSYGHAAGDFALTAAAEILNNNTRTTDIVARLGGDEFGIFSTDFKYKKHILNMASRLCEAFAQPISFQDNIFYTGCSVGIAFSDNTATTMDLLQKKADLAMYQAKSQGRGTFIVYQKGMYERHRRNIILRNALEAAIKEDQLSLAYQPVVLNSTGKIKGFEALARWEHPELGNIPPDKFISIAEEAGFMVPLGRCLMRKALKTWSALRKLNPHARDWTLALNVSAYQLHDRSFISDLSHSLENNKLQADDIVLEITETALIRDINAAISLISELKNFGFAIALDDFGTGYSSLSYLDQLPLDIIKIDRGFIAKINEHHSQSPLVESIVRLADIMQLDTVAEGIETSFQHAVLEKMGCKYAQGFYFYKPISEADLLQESFVFQSA